MDIEDKVGNDRPPIPVYKTAFMPLAAYLRYMGFIVQEVEKVGTTKVEFVFHKVDREVLDEFNAGDSCAEPKLFSSIMKQLVVSARRATNG